MLPTIARAGASVVGVAAAASAVGRGSELPLKLHEAPDPGAVGAEVRLDLCGQRADGGQLDTEQLGASLQRRRDRPAQVRVVAGSTDSVIEQTSMSDNGTSLVLVDSRWSTAGRPGRCWSAFIASRNGEDGIDVDVPATTLTRNIANRNRDLGIEAVPGVIDGGGNRAAGNGNPAQCTNIDCR